MGADRRTPWFGKEYSVGDAVRFVKEPVAGGSVFVGQPTATTACELASDAA